MRLMKVDTARYTVKRPSAQPDENYIGTKNVWSVVGYVIGQLTHANDKLSVERYGDKSASMYTLMCSADADIALNDRVVLDNGEYTVISCMKYKYHIVVTLEKAGV